jgi:hypothetical protein
MKVSAISTLLIILTISFLSNVQARTMTVPDEREDELSSSSKESSPEVKTKKIRKTDVVEKEGETSSTLAKSSDAPERTAVSTGAKTRKAPKGTSTSTPTPSKSDSKSTSKSKSTKTKKTSKTKSSTPKTAKKEGGDILLNIGAGPAYHRLTNPLNDEWHYGINLDIHVVVPSAVLKARKDDIPSQYRKFIDLNQDMELRPLYLAAIPSDIFISPKNDGHTAVYGATWHMYGLGVNLIDSKSFRLGFGVKVPTLTFLYIDSDHLTDDEWMLGLGATGAAHALIPLSKNMFFSAEWKSNLYLPLEDTKLKPIPGTQLDDSNHLWHIGTAAFLIHYRFPVLKNF